MKKLILTFALLLVPVSLCSGQRSLWKEFRSKEPKFTVNLPGQPKQEKENDPDSGVTYTTSANMGDETYKVMVTLLNGMDVDLADDVLAKVYDSGAEAAQGSLENSKMVVQSDIRFNGHLGREYTVENSEISLTGRMILIRGRLYQLIVGIPAPSHQTAQAKDRVKKFFDSFTIE